MTCLESRWWPHPPPLHPHVKGKHWWAPVPSRSERTPTALKRESGIEECWILVLELSDPLPLLTWALQQGNKVAGGMLWRCGVPWSLNSLSQAHCSPLNACRSWPGFSWPGFSLIWGNLLVCVVSRLRDREANSILYCSGNILTPLWIFEP